MLTNFAESEEKKFSRSHNKQPLEVFSKVSCSWKFCKFQRKTYVLESLFNKKGGRRVINEKLRHRYVPVSFTKFLRTHILKNFYEWLLTKLFYENKPPALEKKKDYMYLSDLVLLYQQIFVFSSSPVFPRDLHWTIKYQILSDRTINFPYVYALKHWTNQLEFMKWQSRHWEVLWKWICEQMEEVVRARNPFHLTQV